MHLRLLLAACILLAAGCARQPAPAPLADDATWSEIVSSARGATVRMQMWDGDPLINAYMRDYVAQRLRDEHDIRLQLSNGQGNSVVMRLAVDLDAGRSTGDIDLIWINGETFYQLRKIGGLYGPFTERLPNNALIAWDDPSIAFDFQQPVDGYECPWGNVQLAIIYNSDRVTDPPRNLRQLAKWVQQHPGRFTWDTGFTGLTFLKSLLYEIAADRDAFAGEFSPSLYQVTSEQLWEYLHQIRPYLWRKGETFPEGVAQLHQLMNNGEVDFSMSNNDGEVANKVQQGILPPSSRAYVLDFGTIRNTHYLGIPFNAPNKAAAMVVCNLLISPEAQLQKMKPQVWGDGTVLAMERLSEPMRQQFAEAAKRELVASRQALQQQALMEPAPEWMIRLNEDFRAKFLEVRR